MARTLVIGYGNSLRRDDGAGPEVARRLEELALPGVDVIEAHQLLPEHAERLSHYDRVIFVDATMEDDLPEVCLQPIAPKADAGIDAHASDPGALLALALLLFERAADGWIVRLPVEDLGIGDGLSGTAGTAVEEAVEVIRGFCG
jgi:hydrogenase maturation protease